MHVWDEEPQTAIQEQRWGELRAELLTATAYFTNIAEVMQSPSFRALAHGLSAITRETIGAFSEERLARVRAMTEDLCRDSGAMLDLLSVMPESMTRH